MSRDRVFRRALALSLLVLIALLLLMQPANTPQNTQTTAIPATPTSVVPVPQPNTPALVADAPRTEEKKIAPEANAVFDAFNAWTEQYVAADVQKRASLLKEGEALADARRVEFKNIIRTNPEAAWAKSVSPAVAAQLPASIQSQLEKRVSARGDIHTVVGTSFDGDRPRAQRSNSVVIGDAIYEAHLYGRRAKQTTVRNTPLHGLAIDQVMAVHADTARLLEPSELTPQMQAEAKDARCPISGKSIAAQSLAVASVGGRAVYLCHQGHIVDVTEQENAAEDSAVAQEGGNGGGQKPSGFTFTNINDGPKTLLYIRLIFPDVQTDPQNEENCYAMLKDMNDFWVGNSHGRCYFIPTVTPPIMMPRTSAWYAANDSGNAYIVLSDAREAARKAGYDYTAYDLEAVRYNGAAGGFGGQAYVGGRGCWLKSSSTGVAAHEFGHNMGLWHANFWDTNPDDSVIGPGSHVEYGHSFDTMGAASAGNNYFNSNHQNKINWLPDEFIANANTSGTYRIFQLDQPQLENGRTYALKVPKDLPFNSTSTGTFGYRRSYWGEFRQRFTSNKFISNGVMLHWSPWELSESGAHLLDTTPGTPSGKDDAALILGRTFSDYSAGVHITPVSKNGTTPESLDVVVNLGTFPANSAPNFSNLTASSTTPAVNTSVTFTATASDPNGDTLAYYWDFGDGQYGGNTIQSATPSMTFTTAGHYNVVCTVTDMKGMTVSRSILITVGTPATFRISGQVTSGGSPLMGALVRSGNYTTTTDSAGNYTLGRLPTGSYTITVYDEGYTFTTQTIAVGPDQSGVNFAGTALPAITVSAPDAVMTEAGETSATIRFSRTGSTAAAQNVRFHLFKDQQYLTTNPLSGDTDFLSFSAAPTFDSTTYAYSLTIPAGSASLDWVIAARDDATAEGPETLRAVVFPTSGYVTGPSSQATVELQDNDGTPKGKVFITAEDVYGGETGGNTASFRVSRTGSTASALTVVFSDSGGTATTVSDYTSLGTQITLNAGEASKLLVVSPFNDSAAEGVESVRVTLSTNAAYDIDFSANFATVFIQDDDINVLTLNTTDANAAETGQDPGIFVVARTGSTTNALAVNYSISGTALNGNDYFNLPGVVTIPAGQTSAAITVIPYDDNIGEPSQTVVVTLESDVKYQLSTPYAGTVTIVDGSDAPYVTVNASDAYAKEGGDNGTFTLFRPKTGASTTVNYTISGTASGSDYTALAGSVVFAAGDTTKTVTIAPDDDSTHENVETVILTLTPDAAYVINDEEGSAAVYIHDNEKVEVNVAVSNTVVTETSAAVPFFLNRTSSTGALTVNFTLTGTATNGSDYTTVPLSVTFADGAGTAVVNIDATDDAVVEGTETVAFTLSDSPDYSVGAANTTTMYIGDSESPTITVQFGAAISNGSEGTGTVNIPVTLSAAAGSNVTVEYAPYSGNAFEGNDYTLAAGQLTFTPGQTSRNITLTVANDSQVEGAETIGLRLFNPYGARLGTTTQHTYTINDDDSYGAARVGFAAATGSTTEPVGTTRVDVVLSAALASAAAVNYSVTGGTATGGGVDFTLGAGTLTFAAGDTLKTISFPIVDDTFGESTETIVITLSAPSNSQVAGNATHTLSINDDDTPNTLPTISNSTDRSTNEDTSTGMVNFTINDAETPVASLTCSATSSNTTLVPNANIVLGGSGGTRTFNITPAANQNGTTTITLTVNDSQGGSASDTFVLTVNAVNDPPTISNITNKGVPPNLVSGPHSFTVGDLETAAGSLTLTKGSSNTTLLPVANIVFGGSGANRTVTLTPAAGQMGTVTVTVTVSDGALTASDTFVLNVDPSLAPPTVATAAAITPTPVTTTTAQLSVLGADNSGEAALTYSWATTGTPPAPVVFSANGTNGAKNSQATFSAPGMYNFTVTVTDGDGLTVTSSVTGTVVATLTTLTVAPATAEIETLATQVFTVTGTDQFGQSISTGTVTWTVSGGGTIAADGTFSAGTQAGSFTVTGTAGAVFGTATVTLTAPPGPQLGSGIAIVPNPSTAGETVAFTVSVSGVAPFTYAWDFGDGSTSSSTNALHVYTGAGGYAVSVTVTDANGVSATATATATVNDGSGGLPPAQDSDGDGVSDANEVGDGTDPNDASSFVMSPMTVVKMKMSVRFDQTNKDTIQFSGVLPGIPAGFNPLGAVMGIDAGGAKASITLDAKGRGKTANASVGLKLKFVKNKTTKKSSFLGGDVPVKGSLKAGSWADEWADDGLTGAADAKKAPMTVPVVIAFNGRLYGTTVTGVYSAKTGKSGKFSK